MKFTGENIFERFTADILSEQESALVWGGKRRRKPKSRDKDIFDIDDDEDDDKD